ncbi:MAG: hypothetical protein JNN11_03790 [Candidatus Doudnabacteria bacterium]|nr:hypothetical protein [Candidatus Doudnabacteria bacterium]
MGFLRSNLSEYTVVRKNSKKKRVKLVFPSLSQAESYMSTIWLTNYGRATAKCQTDYYLAHGNGERYWRVTSTISPHFTHVEPPPGYSAKQTEYSAVSTCDAGVRGYAIVYGPSGAVALYDAK